MPAMFALGDKVIDNPALATFAAFGAFALLLLVDFSGPMRSRLEAQAALSIVGAVFVCLGTLASRASWLAALAMAIVGFGVLFVGVVSSVLASATTSLLLAFILPVSIAGPVSSIPDRLEGWGLASGAAFLAVALLWPAPTRDPLRQPALVAIRALAARLRSDVAVMLGDEDPAGPVRAAAVATGDGSVSGLRRVFFSTPYRPTGLSTAARTIVRLVDDLTWLHAIILQSLGHAWPSRTPVNHSACKVKLACASVLERGADLLDADQGPEGGRPEALHAAMDGLRNALADMEQTATVDLPIHREPASSAASPGAGAGAPGGVAVEERITEFITSLDPTFRSQELSYVVGQIATNIDFAVAAERRSGRRSHPRPPARGPHRHAGRGPGAGRHPCRTPFGVAA